MNYSVCFKDARGITERSEVTPFPSDTEALSYARAELPGNAGICLAFGGDFQGGEAGHQERSLAWAQTIGAPTAIDRLRAPPGSTRSTHCS